MSSSLRPYSSLLGFSAHWILQARILECKAISFRGSSQPRDPTWSPPLQADSLLPEPPGNPIWLILKSIPGLQGNSDFFSYNPKNINSFNLNTTRLSILCYLSLKASILLWDLATLELSQHVTKFTVWSFYWKSMGTHTERSEWKIQIQFASCLCQCHQLHFIWWFGGLLLWNYFIQR